MIAVDFKQFKPIPAVQQNSRISMYCFGPSILCNKHMLNRIPVTLFRCLLLHLIAIA